MEKTIKNAPIGVFDSGVGGLTVVREIMRHTRAAKAETSIISGIHTPTPVRARLPSPGM